MDKINVVHLVEDLNVGGLERTIATIAFKINKDKFNIKVWCLVKGGKILDELRDNAIDVEILGMKSPHNPLFYIKLVRKLRNNGIHIAHTHGVTANGIGCMAAILAKTPVIITHIHTIHIKQSYKSTLKDRFLNIFTDKIICCSKAVADFVIEKERVNSRKVIVIYNGVDIDKFKSKSDGIVEDKGVFTIGCIASLYPHKGHYSLLEAVKKVTQKTPQKVKLIIVGDGILRDDLENYAEKLGIKELVEFKGIISDIASVMPMFNLIILPSSKREGLGLSLIEAMASGLPVIGTNIGGISEVIDDGKSGLLIEPNDSESMAKAILLIINDKNKALAMGERGREIVKDKFSACFMVREIENLYIELFKQKSGNKI